MRINLEKASGKAKCRSGKCRKLPEYIDDKGRIKAETTCAAIGTDSASGWHTSYYCRDCIDQLYDDIRKILNPKLWVFH